MLPQRIIGSMAVSALIAGGAALIVTLFGADGWLATIVATLLAALIVLARRII